MSTEIVKSVGSLISPELKAQLQSEDWKIALNSALAEYQVTFDPKQGSLTKMCKMSPKYNALPEGKERSAFINLVKTILKAHYVGERFLLKSAAAGHWARLNGVVEDKRKGAAPGTVKQVNISMMAPDVAASPADKEFLADVRLKAAAENERIAKEQAARVTVEKDTYLKLLEEAGIPIPEIEAVVVE